MNSNERGANVVLTADTTSYRQNIGQAESQTSALLGTVERLTRAMATLTQSTGRNIQLVSAGTLAGLTGATAAAGKFQAQIQQLEASSIMSSRSIEATTATIRGMRSELNMSTGEVVGLITQLNKLGQGGNSIGGIATEFVKLGAVTGESIPALTQNMTMLQRQMGNEGLQNTRRYAGMLAHLSENAGTSANSILEFANAIAPVAQMSKMSQTEIMGFSTAFAKAGADGYAGANALNKMLSDINRATLYGGPELKAYANLIGVTSEEFKKLSASEQVTKIFETIIKQGPEAIATLDRFGMDGARTLKAFTAVAQQGGIREALGMAEEGGTKESFDKYTQAATEALSGLNDELGKLGNTLSRIGQAFGVGLIEPVTKSTQILNTMLTPLAKIMELMGSIPGLATALGALSLGAAGTLVRGLPMLMGAAGIAQVARSGLGAGFRVGRVSNTIDPSQLDRQAMRSLPPWIRQTAASGPAQMGFAQRNMYRLGAAVGMGLPGGGQFDPNGGPGLLGRGFRGLNFAAAQGINLAGWAARVGLDPLRPSRLQDITNREQLTQNLQGRHFLPGYWGSAIGRGVQGGAQWLYSRGSEMRSSALGDTASIQASASQRAAKAATDQTTQSMIRYRSALTATVGEVTRLGLASARAAAGLTIAGGGIAMAGAGRLAGAGLRGLRGLATSTMGLVGGPIGVAALGGLGLYTGLSAANERKETALSRTEDMSSISAYNTALGKAAGATMTFADTVIKSANQISGGGDPRTITAQDISTARNPSISYSDQRFADMTEAEAKSFISTALVNADDGTIQLIKLDALKKFNNTAMVSEWLQQDTPSIRGMFWGLTQTESGWRIGASEEGYLRGATVSGTAQSLLAAAPESQRETVRAALVNEAVLGVLDVYKDIDTGRKQDILDVGQVSLAQMLGATNEDDLDEIRGALNAAAGAGSDREAIIRFSQALSGGKSDAADYWRQGGSYATVGLGQVGGEVAQDPFASWSPADETRQRLRSTVLGGAWMGGPAPMPFPVGDTLQSQSNSLFYTGPTGLTNFAPGATSPDSVRGSAVGDLMTKALANLANPSIQAATSAEMQQYALDLSAGDYAQANTRLQEFQTAIGDVNDPLYQLAEAARAANRALQAIEVSYMSTSDRTQALADQLDASRAYYEANPESMTGYLEFQQNREAFEQARLDQHQRNLQVVYGRRELDISLAQQRGDVIRQTTYAASDFSRQRDRAQFEYELSRSRQAASRSRQVSRAERDFGRQMGYSEEDFAVSRQRQDEAYARQLARSWRDFHISRERAEYEFNLQRMRGQEQFDLQLERSNRDYNKGRRRAYEDFDISRRRQEEDFNHQVEIMARQTAQSVYNIYERVAVARTLSGENMVRNMADQQRRLQEQTANLDVARGMGLTDAAIQMLGLGDAANSQQLARLVQDMANDPALVEALNQMVTERTDATTKLITDSSSLQWEEMQRQYQLSVDRAAEDFAKSMDRQAEDFARGLSDMREDYNRSLKYSQEDFERARRQQKDDFLRSLKDQSTEYMIQVEQSGIDFEKARRRQILAFETGMADQREEYNIMMDQQQEDWDRNRAQQLEDFVRSNDKMFSELAIQQNRAQESFNRRYEEITGSFSEIAQMASDSLTGVAKSQMDKTNEIMTTTSTSVRGHTRDMVDAVNEILEALGLETIYMRYEGGTGGGGGRNQYKAEGGTIQGFSPHAKADNIPIWATAGEYMQPVHSVQHYGVNVMDAIREKKIPKEMLQGFAEGGLVGGTSLATLINFGRWLQGQGYHVGEHPLFGGVHPGAHLPTSRGGRHYIGEAIDVNYDGYGQAVENRMLDKIIATAESIGLGYIWRSANHYGHAHFDTSTRRRLNGVTTWGLGHSHAIGSLIDTDADGNVYAKTLFDELLKNKDMKKWEGINRDSDILNDRYIKDGLSKLISIKMAAAIMDQGAMVDDLSSPDAGQGVQRWRGTVLRALQIVGQPDTLVGITLQRMMQESSGNPNAINLWDSNAKAGTPSKGLMQVIDPTFAAYRDKELVNDIWNPLANIVASMRYAMARYGSIYKAYSRAGGYAEGGMIDNDWYSKGSVFKTPTRIGVGEAGPEIVLPLNKQGAAFLSEVLDKQNAQVRAKDALVARQSVPEASKRIIYNYKYDHSVNFTGPVNVAANDPNELARKMEAKKRESALIGRH